MELVWAKLAGSTGQPSLITYNYPMTLLPELDLHRRRLGIALFLLGCITGAGLLVVLFLAPPLFQPDTGRQYGLMLVGALLAVPAAAIYLTVPRLLDRYDPEPVYALMGCFTWGAVAACGWSALINSIVQAVAAGIGGPGFGEVMGAVVSAPLVEEFWKGLAVLGVFYFLRREFDGVVDGVIYATFTALGFAMVENVIYYAKAASEGGGVLGGTFFIRGILAPWGHPLYTSMIGLGLGIARETNSTSLRILGPLGGYLTAVILHAVWNGSAVLAGTIDVGGILFILSIPLWLFFVLMFLIIVIVLVRRRGRIIREYLRDEVAIGNMTQIQADIVGSAFGGSRLRRPYGKTGDDFIKAAARLALSKWHATRAMKGKKYTVSVQFVVPLRQRLAELQRQMQHMDAQRRRVPYPNPSWPA